MQKLLVEVSHQDQIFVEDECTKKGYSISKFFEILLNEYRGRTSQQTTKEEECINDQEEEHCEPKEDDSEPQEESKPEKKRGKRKKQD